MECWSIGINSSASPHRIPTLYQADVLDVYAWVLFSVSPLISTKNTYTLKKQGNPRLVERPPKLGSTMPLL